MSKSSSSTDGLILLIIIIIDRFEDVHIELVLLIAAKVAIRDQVEQCAVFAQRLRRNDVQLRAQRRSRGGRVYTFD